MAQNKWLQTNFYTINYRKLNSLVKDAKEQELAIVSSQDEPTVNNSVQLKRSKRLHNNSALAITAPAAMAKPPLSNPPPIGLPYSLSPVAQAYDFKRCQSRSEAYIISS